MQSASSACGTRRNCTSHCVCVCRHDKQGEHAEFIIDETFGVPGVGTVIAGTVKKGCITTGSSFLLGPDVGDGTFKPCAIKSIHYKRLPVQKVTCALLLSSARSKLPLQALPYPQHEHQLHTPAHAEGGL